MLSSRLITQLDELAIFSTTSYRLSLGTPAEIDYLSRSAVRIFFQERDPTTFLAGYAINQQPPFRYLTALEQLKQLQRVECPTGSGLHDLAEISCLWMNKCRIQPHDRIRIYTQLLIDMIQTDKSIFIAGSLIKKYQGMLEYFFPTTLFEGAIPIGDRTHDAKIFAIHRSELVGRFLKTLIRLLILPRSRPQ